MEIVEALSQRVQDLLIVKKEREDKLLNEFNIFKSLIDKCKKIQQIPEIKLINIHLWEKIKLFNFSV